MTALAMPTKKTPAKGSRHLRKQSNVRLSDAARAILAEGVVSLGISQAAVIELALREMAKREGFDVRPASRPQSAGLIEETLGKPKKTR